MTNEINTMWFVLSDRTSSLIEVPVVAYQQSTPDGKCLFTVSGESKLKTPSGKGVLLNFGVYMFKGHSIEQLELAADQIAHEIGISVETGLQKGYLQAVT